MRVSDPNRPAIIGFDVPALRVKVDHVRDAPIIVFLNCAPTELWVSVFRREVDLLRTELGSAGVEIKDAEIEFYGSTGDFRALTGALRALVDKVTRLALAERSSARQ